MTCMVYLPRDRYNTPVRLRIQDVLVRHLNAESLDYNVFLDESVLARLFYRIQLPKDWRGYDQVDHSAIEDDLVMAVRRSEEHTSELQSRGHLVCRLLLEKKNNNTLIHCEN